MPNIAYGNSASVVDVSQFRNVDLGYTYPNNLDLRPGHKLHKSLVDKVIRYARGAADNISKRFDSWNIIDETLTSYIELDSDEEEVIEADHRKPVSIVYPYSYAILETILGYLTAAFFQDPIFMYEGVSPEDIIGAISLEKVIDLHCNRSKIALNLHTMFRDSLSYGFGIVGPSWKKVYGKKIVKSVERRLFRSPIEKKQFKEQVIFEGNSLVNIDPYLSLPDPSVPITDLQKGNFFGWVDSTNYLDLLAEEKHN